jgi:hypothetical protein
VNLGLGAVQFRDEVCYRAINVDPRLEKYIVRNDLAHRPNQILRVAGNVLDASLVLLGTVVVFPDGHARVVLVHRHHRQRKGHILNRPYCFDKALHGII